MNTGIRLRDTIGTCSQLGGIRDEVELEDFPYHEWVGELVAALQAGMEGSKIDLSLQRGIRSNNTGNFCSTNPILQLLTDLITPPVPIFPSGVSDASAEDFAATFFILGRGWICHLRRGPFESIITASQC